LREANLLKELRSISKSFFTVSDLEKITGIDRKSLYVALNRWVSKGVLERAGRNIYVVADEPVRPEEIAAQVYFPCYLSFESVLSRTGVLNLVPYSLTFATTRKTKSIDLFDRRVDYRHLKQELFFGFAKENGLYIAEPEKALLDLIYLAAFGKATVQPAELDLKSLSAGILQEYARRFPQRVPEALDRLT
jgi:predicted transcriptional regulator of viral defense system